MLILFDFENIQNAHYQDIKRLIIDKIGYADWAEAKKYGAVAEGNENKCLRDWNSNVKIYIVENYKQAADDKLVETAIKHHGNRCILVSNDNLLFERVQKARLDSRRTKVTSRGLTKTKTYQILHINGELTLQINQR